MTQWSDCCDLYEATTATAAGPRAGLPGVYVLGSLRNRNEQIAITRQQVRALNLVHALIEDARLGRGGRLCVVGAGAAGLTAGAYASTHGVRVTVLESRMPLWNLRGCHTRWLHPNLFPLWPGEGWNVTATDFPVMNWYADYADRVGALLWAKFQSYVPAESVIPIDPDRLQIACDRSPVVSWTTNRSSRSAPQPFDAVILAVGFGSEPRMRDAAASVYWIDDALERANPHASRTRYLVSGTGDGGLTDLLRIRIAGFRHHHLRDLMTGISAELALQHHAAEIEVAAREMFLRAQVAGQPTTEADAYLTRELLALVRQHTRRSSRIFPRLRDDTQVVLTGRDDYPFSPQRAWPVSRFLAALLLASDPVDTQDDASGPSGTGVEPAVGDDSRAPRRFRMATARGQFLDVASEPCGLVSDSFGRDFDAVVYRHGPEPTIQPLLRQLSLPDPAIAAIEQKWTDAWTAHGGTAQPMDWVDARYDYGRRHRAHAVRPPAPGRTPIGLLSRLVNIVDPGYRVPVGDAERITVIRTDLVTDTLALQVAAIEDRFDVGRNPGWRMGGEVDLQPVIQALRAIDQSLDCLVDKAHCDPSGPDCTKCRGRSVLQRREELEIHLIPAPAVVELTGARALLMQVVAARSWSSRRLWYAPNGRRFSSRRRARPLPRDLFLVVDFPDDGVRAVWADGARDEDLRLARELAASWLFHAGGAVDLRDPAHTGELDDT